MPLKDLLWACPACHGIEALGTDGRCRACGSVYRRGRGARIVRLADGGREERTALEWLGALPWPDLDGEGTALPGGLQPPFEAAVQVREAGVEQPVRRAGAFLGFIERFGPPSGGRLHLDFEALRFTAQSGSGEWAWQLGDMTAVQPASSTIQLKARGRAVISVRFTEGSVRLWEQRLKYCIRHAFRTHGRAAIREFQPRIRPA